MVLDCAKKVFSLTPTNYYSEIVIYFYQKHCYIVLDINSLIQIFDLQLFQNRLKQDLRNKYHRQYKP